MARVTVEDCVDKVPNRFDLVLYSAFRARQLSGGAEPLIDRGQPTVDDFCRGLKAIGPLCRWTAGNWDFGDGIHRRWNDIQNTPKDVQMLTSYLLYEYRRRS